MKGRYLMSQSPQVPHSIRRIYMQSHSHVLPFKVEILFFFFTWVGFELAEIESLASVSRTGIPGASDLVCETLPTTGGIC